MTPDRSWTAYREKVDALISHIERRFSPDGDCRFALVPAIRAADPLGGEGASPVNPTPEFFAAVDNMMADAEVNVRALNRLGEPGHARNTERCIATVKAADPPGASMYSCTSAPPPSQPSSSSSTPPPPRAGVRVLEGPNIPMPCTHCWHSEYRPDCRAPYGSGRASVMRCCKCRVIRNNSIVEHEPWA